MIVNTVLFIIAIIYWSSNKLNPYLLADGTVGAVFNVVGVSFLTFSIEKGSYGPIFAFLATSDLFLVTIEAIKKK